MKQMKKEINEHDKILKFLSRPFISWFVLLNDMVPYIDLRVNGVPSGLFNNKNLQVLNNLLRQLINTQSLIYT